MGRYPLKNEILMDEKCEHCDVHAEMMSDKRSNEKKISQLCREGEDLKKQVGKFGETALHLQYIRTSLDSLTTKVDDLTTRVFARIENVEKTMRRDYVTSKVFEAAFSPVRMIAYGAVGIIIAAAVGWVTGKGL